MVVIKKWINFFLLMIRSDMMISISYIKGFLMDASASLAKITQLAANLEALITENKEGVLTASTANGKFFRRYNKREACEATNTHSRKISELCEKLNIDHTRFGSGKSWAIDINDVYRIRESLGHGTFSRTKSQDLQVICVSSLKGGPGKTTSTVTLSSGVATELLNNYRVGVIDLDPQATGTMFCKPNFSDDDMSVGDLLMGHYELEDGETFADVCKSSFYDTNIPNLRVLCARTEDREYDYYVKNEEERAAAKGEAYNAYEGLQSIINAVKDDFDIIFIDTSPQFSALTLAGHYVANSLIIPIKPAENDRDSSEKYLRFLANMYNLLVGMGHDGYNMIKILISGTRRSSAAQMRIANKIRTACDENEVFLQEFTESDAVTNCAEDYCTVYDMSVSEYPASKQSLKNAQQEYMHLITEIERNLLRAWEK